MNDPVNILMIMTDQHRVDTLGCYGAVGVQTPVLDALAQSGTRFDRFYTPTAICTPARASLLTGRYPFRHGLLSNYEWNSGALEELPDGLPAFSRTLREAGYNVGHVGKWHVGRVRGPEFYGFDGMHIPGPLNVVDHPAYVSWLEEHGYPPFHVTDAVHGLLPDGSQGHLLAARLQQPAEATFEAFLTDLAIADLRRYAADRQATGQPFYLNCHYFGPHLPYLIPDSYFDRCDPASITLPESFTETFDGKPEVQRRYSQYWGADSLNADQWRKLIAVYHGYVMMIDEQIGRLVAVLDELGLAESTAVMFTADHGEFTGAHRLNDKGPAMYEDIYRIPALLHVPGRQAAVDRHFCSLMDVYPTVLELAGLDPDPDADGRSLLPLLGPRSTGDPANSAAAADGSKDPTPEGEPWRDALIAEFHGHHFPYPQRMIRTDRYKLVINPESVNELYDLDIDPSELRNVHEVPTYAAVRQELTRKLFRELRKRDDRFFQWMNFMSDLGDEPRYELPTSLESRV